MRSRQGPFAHKRGDNQVVRGKTSLSRIILRKNLHNEKGKLITESAPPATGWTPRILHLPAEGGIQNGIQAVE